MGILGASLSDCAAEFPYRQVRNARVSANGRPFLYAGWEVILSAELL